MLLRVWPEETGEFGPDSENVYALTVPRAAITWAHKKYGDLNHCDLYVPKTSMVCMVRNQRTKELFRVLVQPKVVKKFFVLDVTSQAGDGKP